MAFLQIIPLGLIILNIRSLRCDKACSPMWANFSCETYGTNAEYKKTTNITCKNNMAITSVAVKFCPYNNCSCPGDSEINTFAGNYTSEGERISLKLDNFAILNISYVEISDKRCYAFSLHSCNGNKDLKINLMVAAPYTKPQLIRKKDTVECTATGGYPDKHLYWFDSHETNLTHNATFMSTQNVDGLFFLNSSLHLDSLANEMTYCCTLNRTSCHSSQNCACMTLEKVRSSKTVSENTTSNSSAIVAIVLIAVLAVAVVAAIYIFKKKRDTLHDFVSLRRKPILEEGF